MLKEAIEKLVSLKDNKIYQIGERDYSDNNLTLIEAPRYRPKEIKTRSLESLVKLIKAENSRVEHPIFVEVSQHNQINVFTTYDQEFFSRNYLYEATSDTPQFGFGWKDYDEAMIAFRSQFAQDEGTQYILNLLSKIADEDSVASADNGLTQTVEVKKGIALKGKEAINPIVKLRPYRTFAEVEQPASEFLLRLREGGQIGLFEADGGAWKLAAKRTIKAYFEECLADEIAAGTVIVTI